MVVKSLISSNKFQEYSCIELFISKKYRGAGFGLKLMEKIGKYFKEKECYKINVEVLALNKNAYNFYKKLGFHERNLDLVKVI